MPLQALEKQFQALSDATNKAIRAAKKLDFDEAINWGDLKCVDVELIIPWRGGSYWVVTVDEASESCPKFQTFIREYLTKKGFEHVEVVTEW